MEVDWETGWCWWREAGHLSMGGRKDAKDVRRRGRRAGDGRGGTNRCTVSPRQRQREGDVRVSVCESE